MLDEGEIDAVISQIAERNQAREQRDSRDHENFGEANCDHRFSARFFGRSPLIG
jgi:hypothetical protein